MSKKKELFKFKDAVYWHDYESKENVKTDFSIQVLSPCIENNIILEKWRFTEFPSILTEQFDILFFDWGGMSLGNSMMEHFCSYIIKHANDHSSRFYVMVSLMTKAAMKDALYSFGDNKPFNVFLTIEDLEKHLKKNK